MGCETGERLRKFAVCMRNSATMRIFYYYFYFLENNNFIYLFIYFYFFYFNFLKTNQFIYIYITKKTKNITKNVGTVRYSD